jgi:hypothetical protein
MGSAPIEDPVADVVEQHQEVEQGEADDQEEAPSPGEDGTPERGWEVDEADAAEQSQEVPLDEEEWR